MQQCTLRIRSNRWKRNRQLSSSGCPSGCLRPSIGWRGAQYLTKSEAMRGSCASRSNVRPITALPDRDEQPAEPPRDYLIGGAIGHGGEYLVLARRDRGGSGDPAL